MASWRTSRFAWRKVRESISLKMQSAICADIWKAQHQLATVWSWAVSFTLMAKRDCLSVCAFQIGVVWCTVAVSILSSAGGYPLRKGQAATVQWTEAWPIGQKLLLLMPQWCGSTRLEIQNCRPFILTLSRVGASSASNEAVLNLNCLHQKKWRMCFGYLKYFQTLMFNAKEEN